MIRFLQYSLLSVLVLQYATCDESGNIYNALASQRFIILKIA
jgi:hypothetical protein